MSKTKIDAIILHTDGSCVPNPGKGGWGIHGYAYSNEAPKKGSGNPTHYVTNMGYVDKDLLDGFRKGVNPFEEIDRFTTYPDDICAILEEERNAAEVTPIFYLDYFGPMEGDATLLRDDLTTNNACEIMALIQALEFCKKEDIRTIQIFADSEYTKDGFTKALPIWAANQWRRRDQTEIKNKGLWQRAWELKKAMADFEIAIDWRRGHSIFVGINTADSNANLGRLMAVEGLNTTVLDRCEAQGYWKGVEVDKHPLIAHQKLFFNGDQSTHTPGLYHLGAIDKDLGLFGKKLSDTSYSVVQVKEPIESLEALIEHHCESDGHQNQTVVAHLAQFFKSDTYRQFMEFGKFALYQIKDYVGDLSNVNKNLVTEVVEPPKKAMDAVLAVNNVATWMNDWLLKRPGHERFVETDLTDHLYESSIATKKKKEVTVTKLAASIKPGASSIEVDANFRTAAGEDLKLPTILSFGIDLADRLGLKRIEELAPKVTLLSWEESPGVFRYFTVIQAGDDVGAYCGYYSNVRLNRTKKKAK